ncbi:hypothetical protein GUJ93_ZPchr0007g5014 [Zizania palustris]|uniref:Uncharacterized protein n=1 Tax=Zizania palustris TaxID=103762 RepID=A0A8J5TJM2_ZIZPA|nr:hypothetical protein GUJ93_ZPchr0007g5014 [Zizania palustris]
MLILIYELAPLPVPRHRSKTGRKEYYLPGGATNTWLWVVYTTIEQLRYAVATQLWHRWLHVMGGGKEDRHEAGLEHWILVVNDDKALENGWQTKIPMPHAVDSHRELMKNSEGTGSSP